MRNPNYQEYQMPKTQAEDSNSIQINFPNEPEKIEKASACAINSDSVRKSFIRKVLGIIFCQMMVSVFFVLLALFVRPYQNFQNNNVYLFLIAIFVEIFLFILMICNKTLCRRVPYNYLCLFTFTIAVSYILSYLCAISSPEAVIAATVSTTVIVSLLAIYSLVTNRDLTTNVGIVLYVPVGGIILILFLTVWDAVISEIIISLVIVAIFSVFLAYDIQKLSGKFGIEYSIDDYVFAALGIYVDIILIFKNLLIIFGASK